MANYTAFELAEGEALSDLVELCSHLTGDGEFNSDTLPSITTVYRWLTLAYYEVQGHLASAGYLTTQTEPAVVGILQELNVILAAINVELANPTTGTGRVSGEPNDRLQIMRERAKDLIDMIERQDVLAQLGAAIGSSSIGAFLEATGTSKADKISVESDSDLVPFRFRRGFHRNIRDPDQTTADLDRENLQT